MFGARLQVDCNDPLSIQVMTLKEERSFPSSTPSQPREELDRDADLLSAMLWRG